MVSLTIYSVTDIMIVAAWMSKLLYSWLYIGQCCVRVQVVKSESEFESSPLSPSPSPSHHLKVRVPSPIHHLRVRVRVKNLVVHIFNICLSSKTWKQTTKCIECQSKQRNAARPLLLGLGCDSARVTSHDFWVRVRVRVEVKKTGLESESE